MNYKKILLTTMIVSLVISALVGIYLFLVGDWGDTEVKIFATTQAVAFASLLGFCSSLHQNREKLKWLSFLGIAISFLAFLLVTYTIWGSSEDGQRVWQLTSIACIIAFCLAHISLILLVKIKSNATKYALIATIIFIIIVAAMLINAVICDFNLGDLCLRLLGVFVILDVLGTITTPLLNKLTEKKS